MTRHLPLPFLVLLILIMPVATHAQAWSGIIPSSRAADWSQAGVPGGIPVRNTICQTLTPSTSGGTSGSPVSAASIDAAINSCPNGEVVYLTAGNYYLSSGIDFNNHGVTLRGAGANQTFLFAVGSEAAQCDGFICISNNTNSYFGNPSVTASFVGTNGTVGTYAKRATSILLTNTAFPTTAASWSSGTATFTPLIPVQNIWSGNPDVMTTGFLPSGWNVGCEAASVNLSPWNISVPLASNPGAVTQYGTVQACGLVALVPGTTTITLDQCNDGYYGPNCGAGTATASGTTITWSSGDFFTTGSGWVGQTINWGGNIYTIASVTSPLSLQLTTTIPTSLEGGPYVFYDPNGAATDTGNVWNCDQPVCTAEVPTFEYRNGRAQEQTVLVTACTVSGGTCTSSSPGPFTLTISPGLYMSNWQANQTPGAWWSNSTIQGAGVENLSIDDSHAAIDNSVAIYNAYGSWVSGIRSINTSVSHISVGESAHNTIQNNYFYGTRSAASQSYGIAEVAFSDNLIQNNIFDHIACSVCVAGAGEGSVYAYNFTWDGYYIASLNWVAGGFGLHSAGDAMTLFEGNQATSMGGDDFHGTHPQLTLFRNMIFGADPAAPYRSNDTLAVQNGVDSRYWNVVGNVLGTPGYTNLYLNAPPNGNGNNRNAVFFVGYGEIDTTVSPDLLTAESIMKWGNYDDVTGAVRWCGNSSDTNWSYCGGTSEIPSTLNDTTGSPSIYANPIPTKGDTGAGQGALPASFYLSSGPPSFWTTPWGTPAWPPNGPDVTGGNIPNTGGHANNLPAELCYANSPVDTSYQMDTAITGASWAGGVATITVAAMAQPPEGYAIFTGINPHGYNGTYLLTSANTSGSTTTMTYSLASSPGSSGTGGDLVYPYIKLFNASACYGNVTPPSDPPAPAPAPPTGVTTTIIP
jgi:hypothetical protein